MNAPAKRMGLAARIARLAAAGALAWLCACQPAPPTSAPALPPEALPTQEAAAEVNTPAATDTPPATPVIEIAASEPAPSPTPGLPTATPLPDPLRFVFPTPRPAPISAWRPASYPVPWAPTPFDHFYFARPIAADQINWPLQDYRYGGDFLGDAVHTGVDIPAPLDTPVLAVGAGKVIWAGYGLYRGYTDETDPYGLAVAIQHDFGWQNQKLYTVYGHMSEISVVVGQHLQTGDPLGKVGETGRVTGPHLHFEVRVGENTYFSTRNPELWLVPPQGWGVLAGRVLDSNGLLVEKQNLIVTAVESGQNWFSRTYSSGTVAGDPYYQENLVIGDLPAGLYRIRIAYAGLNFEKKIDIQPGVVNYFYFEGRDGFRLGLPPLPQPSLTVTPAGP